MGVSGWVGGWVAYTFKAHTSSWWHRLGGRNERQLLWAVGKQKVARKWG